MDNYNLLLKIKWKIIDPYLQISFELIKSNLTCLVIRNFGKTPLKLTNILLYDEEFIKQLPESEQKYLNNKIDDLIIFPGNKWIVCLGVIVPEILTNLIKKVRN